MSSRRLLLLPGLLCSLALHAGCSSKASATPQKAPASGALPASVKVDTVAVESAPLPRVLPLTGNLLPHEDASVAAGAAGKVVEAPVERGQRVKKGDVLARLDARISSAQAQEAQATAEVARAQAQVAEAECRRSTALFEGGGEPASQHERTLANCKVSAAQVAASEARARLTASALADMTIRAPFDGVVAERHISVGEYVAQQSPVVTLLATDTLRLELTVPEAYASDVRVGQEVKFSPSMDPSRTFTARLTYVGPTVRKASRDLVVEAVVQNKDRQLTPGLFVQATLALGEQRQAVVPQAALREEGAQARVYVVKAGRLEERLVQVGQRLGDKAGILRGVEPGEQVVATARDGLRDGLKVE